MATKNVDPKKSAAAKKAAATRRANREAAARREQETISSRNWNWLPWVLLGAVIIGMLIWRPWTSTATPTPVIPTEVPALLPTTAPVVPTEVPAPVAVTCDTPFIMSSIDNGATWQNSGEYLKTSLGERQTFTTRKIVVPTKQWNDPLTPAELKLVETTWVDLKVCIVDGQTGVFFGGGIEQGIFRQETGALMTLQPGQYIFHTRNSEFVIWYANQGDYQTSDLQRIVDQIRNGNFDIKGELSLFGVTTDLLPKMPQDLVKSKNIQIVPYLKPVVK